MNELIINITAGETRVAFLENGVLSEFMIERAQEIGITNNIYKGKVQRVLPGMNAAFVEIGQDKAAFLYATDFSEEFKGLDELEDEGEENPDSADAQGLDENSKTGPKRRYRWAGRDPLHKVLKGGQEILVQVSRGPISTKGSRITSHISLPGRFLVYLPTWNKLGISQKIESREERNRIRQIMKKIRPEAGGFIIRTAAEGVTEETLEQDVKFLVKLWHEVLRKKDKAPAPSLIQPELDVALRALRDLYWAKIERVWVDDRVEYEKIQNFVSDLMPELASGVKLYQEADPIFDRFGIEAEVNRALGKKVWLKSGGYLIIEQTEALTTIDVNTGKFTGRKNLEETILQNNLESIGEIVYQLKVRNIGGIIILDLIDMEKRANREKVYTALREALKDDRAKTSITKISEIGLIEMTRKRTRESLKGLLGEECPYCEGKGYVKSALTVTYEIFRHLKREAPLFSERKIYLNVHPTVFNILLHTERKGLEKLEKQIAKKIEPRSRDTYHLEQFDLQIA